MASPAAPTVSVIHLLGHLLVRLVAAWPASIPMPAVLVVLDLPLLRHPPRWRTADERQQRLQIVVATAQQVLATVTPVVATRSDSERAPLHVLVQAIRKVIADETATDTTGRITERPSDDKGTYRCQSAVDLQASFRKHEGSVATFGVNAVISTTARRIRACVALTGSTPDSETPTAVVRQLQAAQVPLPPYLIMDQAAGRGPTRAQIDVLSDGQTQMVALIPASGGSDPRRFNLADFQFNRTQTSCTCPNGVVSTRVYAHGSNDGVFFRFLARQCRDCLFWAQCRDPDANPKGHRTVFISTSHAYLRAADAFNHSELGQQLLKARWLSRTDDRLAGALPRLPASPPGRAGGRTISTLSGLRGAQSTHVAEPPETASALLSDKQRFGLIVWPLLWQATQCAHRLWMVLPHPDSRPLMVARPSGDGFSSAGVPHPSR